MLHMQLSAMMGACVSTSWASAPSASSRWRGRPIDELDDLLERSDRGLLGPACEVCSAAALESRPTKETARCATDSATSSSAA